MCKKICNEAIEKYGNGSFIRTFQWNLPLLIPDYCVSSSGYLVQHITRETKDSCNLYSKDSECNHSYWEAWPVQNGHINNPASKYDDMWSWIHKGWIMTQPEVMIEIQMEYYKKRQSSFGTIHMEGDVYWAEYSSALWDVVKKKFKEGGIPWADDLISCSEEDMVLPNGHPLIFYHGFNHAWNLENVELMVSEVVNTLVFFRNQYTLHFSDQIARIPDIIENVFSNDCSLQAKILAQYYDRTGPA